MLYSESAIKWKAPSTSRLPKIEGHESVKFNFVCIRDDDHDVQQNEQGSNNE